MPLTAGWKLPVGSSICLPVVPRWEQVGSQTFTSRMFSPLRTKGEMSRVNGAAVPECGTSVASSPFTKTCARKSTLSKCRSVRMDDGGHPRTPVLNFLRYQIWSFSVTLRPTPERADSGGNGTRISPSKADGLSASAGMIAYSQRPLSDCHASRAICGRGYSRQALSGVTASPKRLMIGAAGAGRHVLSQLVFIFASPLPDCESRKSPCFRAGLRQA